MKPKVTAQHFATWLKDDSLEDAGDLPEPEVLAAEAIAEPEAAVDGLRDVLALIEAESPIQERGSVPS